MKNPDTRICYAIQHRPHIIRGTVVDNKELKSAKVWLKTLRMASGRKLRPLYTDMRTVTCGLMYLINSDSGLYQREVLEELSITEITCCLA